MSFNVGSRVRIKGSKIEGVIGADEKIENTRRVRIDYQDAEKGECQHWVTESEIEPAADAKAAERG